MRKIINFIIKSSADPKQTSATIKFALLGLIPYAMASLGLVCDLGYTCISVNETILERYITTIADTVFLTLTFISAIGTLWGFSRKMYLTATGQNKALWVS